MQEADWKKTYKIDQPERIMFDGQTFRAEIVNGVKDDLIFQFFDIKLKDFATILAEVIEAHYNSTDRFAVEYVKELDSFALLAKDIKTNPMFDIEFHVEQFLFLLDKTIEEIENG